MEAAALICAAHAVGGFLNHRGLTLSERCTAARAAGFHRIGWALEDYQRERALGRSDADILAILHEHGIHVSEVEFVKIGLRGSGSRSGWQQIRRDLLDFAGLVNARHLVCAAGSRTESALSLTAIADDYRSLCEAAGERGVLALVEAMPWSRLSNIGEAAAIAIAADHPQAGIVLDTWHFHRVGGVPKDILAVPANLVRLIQVSDAGPPQGDPFEDTVKRRLFPGDGEFPLADLFRIARRHCIQAPISIEVIGEEADRLSPVEMAQRSFSSTIALLADAGFEPSAGGPIPKL